MVSPSEFRALEDVKKLKQHRLLFERIRKFEPTASPYNDQDAFLNSKARVIFAFGGNRSGKSEIGAAAVTKFAIGEHPVWSLVHKPPVYVRICAPKYQEGCKGIILKKLKQMIPWEELRGKKWKTAWSEAEKTLYFRNHSTFKFKSFEQDINTFGGDDLHLVWDDEHCAEKYFIENFARLSDYYGWYIKTMTPEAGQTWELDYLEDPPKGITVDQFKFSIRRNPYITKKAADEFAASIKDPALRATKVDGDFMALTGKVIPQFNEELTVVPDRKLHPDAYRVFCIDCHHKTPSAALWAAWEPDEQFGQKLVIYRNVKKKLTIPEWDTEIKTLSSNERIRAWWLDETESDTGVPNIYEKESILREFEDLPDHIPFVRVDKSPGSYKAGIMRLWNMFAVDPILRRCQIEIFESCNYQPEVINGKTCGSLVWELKRLVYKKNTAADEEQLRELVRKINDHYFDDLRYIVMNKFDLNKKVVEGLDIGIYGGDSGYKSNKKKHTSVNRSVLYRKGF